MKPLTIWTNFKLPEISQKLLQDSLGEHRLVLAKSLSESNLSKSGPDPLLAECDIAFGQPDPQQIIDLKNLRWVHLSSAGYTRYDRDDLHVAMKSRGAIMTNSSSVFDEPCAEHVLAMMLALARELPGILECSRTEHTWPTKTYRAGCYLLKGQTALIVGFGAIGRRLSELLQPLGMNLVGVRRKIQGNESIRMATIDQLDELLPTADHVINILPASKSTAGTFNLNRIMKMKRSAIFYNIGRGDTVDQFALREALETNRIAAAFLDVTTPEPLPPDDALWTTPHCYISPHTAGGHKDEFERLIKHFAENLTHFERNEPLRDQIA